EGGGSRTVGTILGVLAVWLMLMFDVERMIGIIVLGVCGGMSEALVGGNYSLGCMFMRIEVMLLNGMAGKYLRIGIALPGIIDVLVGVAIAV
uniref:FUSC family protein n=1 Tax=Staphylococcus pettenkoferi TaxID=170573 RepID=UPI0016432EF5